MNLQPAGEYLGEDFYRAGGVPAVIGELLRNDHIDGGALTANGRTIGENYSEARPLDEAVIRRFDAPLKVERWPDSAERQPVRLRRHEDERDLARNSAPAICPTRTTPMHSKGAVVVFDGPEDYHARIDDPSLGIDERTLLVMRGAGPRGYPGGAEVVNMRPPAAIIRAGVDALPCIGDGRQSGTSGSPSILNAAPEAAAGGGLALLRTGDRVRVDLGGAR